MLHAWHQNMNINMSQEFIKKWVINPSYAFAFLHQVSPVYLHSCTQVSAHSLDILHSISTWLTHNIANPSGSKESFHLSA